MKVWILIERIEDDEDVNLTVFASKEMLENLALPDAQEMWDDFDDKGVDDVKKPMNFKEAFDFVADYTNVIWEVVEKEVM